MIYIIYKGILTHSFLQHYFSSLCLFLWSSHQVISLGLLSVTSPDSHILLWNTLIYRRIHDWLNDCKVPRSFGCKTQPSQPYTTVVDSLYEVLMLIFCVLFFSNVELCIMAKNHYFGHSSDDLALQVLFRWYFANQSHVPMSLFLLPTVPNKPYLYSPFLTLVSWTLTC